MHNRYATKKEKGFENEFWPSDCAAMARKGWTRLTINMDPLLAAAAKAQAAEQRRSFSAYCQKLIEDDLRSEAPMAAETAILETAKERLQAQAKSKANPAAHK